MICAKLPPCFRYESALIFPTLLTAIAAIAYLAATALLLRIPRNGPIANKIIMACSVLAVIAHGAALLLESEGSDGVRLSIFAAASVIAWIAVILVLIVSPRMPVGNLLLLLMPFAAVTATVHFLFFRNASEPDPVAPFHALPSLLGFCVLTIAAVQAAIMAYQERQLRHSRSLSTLRMLPPLQTMEELLFQLLWLGVALLSIGIVTGLLVLEDMFAQHVVHHSLLSILSWIVFAVLLWGRHTLGWRGRTAVAWTLIGFVLLVLAYFGSKLVIEIILQR